MKNTISSIPTFYLLAVRFLGAFLILGIISGTKWRLLNRAYLVQGLIMGALIFGAYSVQTLGLHLTTPGKNAFLTAVYCVAGGE